jgi:DNA-binding MarR family transcriptional regulator
METNLNQHLCFNLYKGWREISSFYKDALGNNVSPQNVYILELCELDKKITMNELSNAMHLDGSAVSTLISRMEKKSLVVREHGIKDRRVVFVKLTREGHDFRESLRVQVEVLTRNATKDITQSDIESLQIIVNKITANRVDFRESL